ncbi:MAG: hypothetical protein IJS73_05915 [Paludibacteraceae bacterium]|nr:hypothetical protein [Paludibacteraceae bacterium]
MKRLSIILLMATIVLFPLMAQEKGGRPKGGRHDFQLDGERPSAELIAQRQTERLAHELELTKAQYDSVYQVHLKYAKKRIQRMEAKAEEREQNRLQMDSMSNTIRKYLTEQQAVKYDEMRSRNLKGGPQHRQRPPRDRVAPKDLEKK